MKRYFCMLLVLISLTAGAQTQKATEADNTKGIVFFNGNFNEALAQAKKENKVLFVDFYAVWCVPCKRMAKTVFTLDEVGRYFNQHFISIQIDAEKPENGRQQQSGSATSIASQSSVFLTGPRRHGSRQVGDTSAKALS